MKSQEPPPLSGPSELDQSIAVQPSPDILEQNGASQSLVTITARDGSNQPIRNLNLRAEIRVGGIPVDFGRISARSIVTGSDGKATVVYTAPGGAFDGPDEGIIVSIAVTPVGTDYNNANPRLGSIRLVRSGIIQPPNDLEAAFTFTPPNPAENQTVLFDASTSQGSIVDYRWDFGDGRQGSGRTASNQYRTAGTYVVRLTVFDAQNRSVSTSQSITVGQGAQPTAAFIFSPENPLPQQQVFFNASASRGAPGRTIVGYQWDFGDGSSGSGVTPTHTYAVSGQYNVTLIVTDDVGRTAVLTQGVAIGSDDPVADFTFAPAAPVRGQSVAFSATGSRAVPGRTIVSYTWNFTSGSPGTASGQATTAQWANAGTFNVTLTVVDSAGKSASVTKPVTVAAQ